MAVGSVGEQQPHRFEHSHRIALVGAPGPAHHPHQPSPLEIQIIIEAFSRRDAVSGASKVGGVLPEQVLSE